MLKKTLKNVVFTAFVVLFIGVGLRGFPLTQASPLKKTSAKTYELIAPNGQKWTCDEHGTCYMEKLIPVTVKSKVQN